MNLNQRYLSHLSKGKVSNQSKEEIEKHKRKVQRDLKELPLEMIKSFCDGMVFLLFILDRLLVPVPGHFYLLMDAWLDRSAGFINRRIQDL